MNVRVPPLASKVY